MMSQYNDTLIALEIILINHSLLDSNHFDDIKQYKFMTPELIMLKDELADRYKHQEQPIAEAIWDLYPAFYGKLMPKQHSNIKQAILSATQLKGRVYLYNKLNAYIGIVSGTGKPLIEVIDSLMSDMKKIKGALDG